MAHLQKRDGKYQARYRGPDGRERSKRFARKLDAERWLALNGADLARGAWVDPKLGRVILAKFAYEWLAQRKDLAIRTAELYRYLLDRHIVPQLGARELASVLPSTVAAWHAKLASEHPSTAAKAYRLLSQIMRAAVADRLIASNPCQVRGAGAERAPERPMTSIPEMGALAAAMPEHMRVAVVLAAWCQLRRAELLGLRRRDVDLLHGTLSVCVTRTPTMRGDVIEKAPKTEAGRRTLSIPPNVLPVVAEHLKRFVAPTPNALVLVGEKGGPLGPRMLQDAWEVARLAVGRPELHLHDLRHAGLTWSAAAGASLAELMHRAGHDSPAAAMRYQHATADRDRAIAEALAGLAASAEVVNLADKPRTAEGG